MDNLATEFNSERISIADSERISIATDSKRISMEFDVLSYVKNTEGTFHKAVENSHKNRYDNVLPFDGNIPVSSFYINASWVCNNFIATQFPLENTVNDFWRMIWETQSRVIVNLEPDKFPHYLPKDKCEIYDYNEDDSGKINVYEKLVEEKPGYVRRLLKLSKKHYSGDMEIMFVEYYHFLEWIDHGIPSNIKNFCNFFMDIAKYHNTTTYTVHCMAGLNRTCSLIALLKYYSYKVRNVDVTLFKVACNIRSQRKNACGEYHQYKFINEVATLLESKGFLP